MKLSEGIIKGCEGTYKIRRRFSDGRGGACTLTAAMIGAGYTMPKRCRTEVRVATIKMTFPITRKIVKHPLLNQFNDVGYIVTNLNDAYEWPRLSIAEWLANVVEPQFEQEGK